MRCKVTKIQSNKLFKNPAASYLVNREVLQELVQMKGFYTQKQDRTRKLLAKENKGLFQAVTFLWGKDVAGVSTGRLPHQHDQEFQTDLRSHSCVCVFGGREMVVAEDAIKSWFVFLGGSYSTLDLSFLFLNSAHVNFMI